MKTWNTIVPAEPPERTARQRQRELERGIASQIHAAIIDRLAQEADMPAGRVLRIMQARGNPTMMELAKLAVAMNCELTAVPMFREEDEDREPMYPPKDENQPED